MSILDSYLNEEDLCNEYNDYRYGLFLKEFLNYVDHRFVFSEGTAGDKVRALKEQYIYTSRYVYLFFRLLANHQYEMKHEIKDAMLYLGQLKDPSNNSEVIHKLLNSPFIQDISFDGKNTFKIFSKQYGEIVFELASNYFKNNKMVTDYMKNNEVFGQCHNNAYFISKLFADFYSVTSLCRHYFDGSYYHSYNYNKEEDKVIDLSYNAVIDKAKYYHIFQPVDLSVVLNSRVDEELRLTELKTEQDFDRCELLKIALFKQYLYNIDFHGNLEDAPSLKLI